MCSLSHTFLLLLMLLLLVNPSAGSSSETDHMLSTHEGFIVSKIGYVTKSDQLLSMSFIMQIPRFTLLNPLIKCLTNSHTKDQARRAFREFSIGMKSINATHLDFVTSRTHILEPFIMSSSKQKRAIFMAAIATLFTGALVGVTEAQIHSINSHLKQNTQAISLLKSQIRTVADREILFEHSTVAFLKELAIETEVKLRFTACLDELEGFYSNARFNLAEYQRSIDTIFEAQLRGINFFPLSANLISPDILARIVTGNDVFNSQLYLSHPTLLYNVAKITLVSVGGSLTQAHFVMSFPSIIDNSNYTLHRIQHTGVLLPDGQCAQLKSPEMVFNKGGSFHRINLNHCDSHFNFHICPPDAFSVNESCLQPHGSICNVTRSPCLSISSAMSTPAGILVRNNADHATFRRDLNDKTHPVDLSRFHTAYIEWKDTTHIQIGDTLFISPNVEDTSIEFRNFSTDFLNISFSFTSYDLVNTFERFSRKYNRSLDELLENSFVADKDGNKHTVLIIVCSTLICIIISGSAVITSLLVLRIRHADSNTDTDTSTPDLKSPDSFAGYHSSKHNPKYNSL